jgi:hypothetical protein
MVRVLQLENYESEDTNKTAFIRMSVEEAESPATRYRPDLSKQSY